VPEIAVGKLSTDDRADWRRLFQGYLDFYEISWDEAAFERAWDRLSRDDVIHALGARIDGRLVGIVHFLEHASATGADRCYLQDLFTDPASRGQGVGTALIDAVVDGARSRGCGRVYWHTHESNATARRLYDQLTVNSGFIRYEIEI